MTKEWVEYPITIASSDITNDLVFYNAIAQFSVNET